MSSNTAPQQREPWYAWWSDEAQAAGNDQFVYAVGEDEIHAHGISNSPDFPTIAWADKTLVGTVPDGDLNPRRIAGGRKFRAP